MERKIIFLILLLGIFVISPPVLASEIWWPDSPFGTVLDPDGSRTGTKSTLTDMVRYFYEWGIFIGGVAVLISLIIGGFLYLTSMGNPARMSEAKDRIFSALIGLVLLFSIYLILNTINPELTILTMPEFGVTEEVLLGCDCAPDVDCPDCQSNYKCEGDPNPGDGNKEGTCVFKGFETEPCQTVTFYDCRDCNCAATDTFSGPVDCHSFGEEGKAIKSAKIAGGCSVLLYPNETNCGTPRVTLGDNRPGDECDAPDIGKKYEYEKFQSVKIQEISF